MLVRGDYVAIKKGRLIIRPKSKNTAPDKSLKENVHLIENELIRKLGLISYRYENFTTGIYNVHNGKKEGGVTLHYNNVLVGDSPRLTYTVPLTRNRTTKHGKKGQPLPKNRFRVSSRMAFYKFWLNLELPLPTRLSAFHDCMGKLSVVLLTGTCTTSTKGSSLDKENLAMLEVSHAEILSFYKREEEVQLPDNQLTSTRQPPDNGLTKTPDKEFQQSHTTHGLEPDPTTGVPIPGNKVIREYGYKDSHSIPIDPRMQSNEEWLEEYDRYDY